MSEAADLCYPPKPDANGTAKKYYRRRAYYFGRHNSPESLILFGEWKRRLIETGEPPEVKTVRIDLEHSMEKNERVRKVRLYLWPTATVASSIALAVAITVCVVIFSTRDLPRVDGRPLTAEEMLFVRGLRQHYANVDDTTRTQPERIADLYARLKDKGPFDGPLHEPNFEF